MGNYGEPLLDKNKNLIGYELNKNEYATVEVYYNDNNLLCNKVSIKEFDKINLSFNPETFNFWLDVRTEKGFTREY